MMEDSCKTNSIGEKCVKEYQYAVELLTNPSSERGMEFIVNLPFQKIVFNLIDIIRIV